MDVDIIKISKFLANVWFINALSWCKMYNHINSSIKDSFYIDIVDSDYKYIYTLDDDDDDDPRLAK